MAGFGRLLLGDADRPSMIVAIDGPAAAGKSTVAREVARRLGLTFLDTGAMYRAVTLVCLERGLDPADGEACGRVARDVELDFDAAGRVLLDGRPGEPAIRASRVDQNVSAVSAHASVREAVVAVQRKIAAERGNLVAEGRDTTTVVFPDAEHKFFLVASAAERARRRALQSGEAHRQAAVREDIERRDALDRGRQHSPLVEARDAIVIDTEGLDLAAVVAAVLEHVAHPRRREGECRDGCSSAQEAAR